MSGPKYDPVNKKFVSHSFDINVSAGALDLHKLQASRKSKIVDVRGNLLGIDATVTLDVNAWLPAAAEHYNISRDIRDYVLHPTVVNISGIPNTHGDGFSLREWLQFKPKFGCLAYKTFRGKPTFIEHANNDYREASGAIFDAHLTRLPNSHKSHARLLLLLAFDRSRQTKLCNAILDGTHNTYSKGTWYTKYTCSICGETFTSRSLHKCNHVGSRLKRLPNGLLAYRDCGDLEGFETSAVGSPAFVCAAPDPDRVLDPRNKSRWS